MVSANGLDWASIPFDLPNSIKLELQAIPFAVASRGCDKLAWKDSKHGLFSLDSAYKIATNQVRPITFGGTWIWNVKILPRIQTFVWLCLHNSIGVRECLVRRGLLSKIGCPLCNSGSESILHALRDCEVVKPIWSHLGVNGPDNHFVTSNITDWLEENGTKQQTSGLLHAPWCTIFLFAIWTIWKHRNLVVFKNQRPNPHLANDIVRYALEYTFCAALTERSPSVFQGLSAGQDQSRVGLN